MRSLDHFFGSIHFIRGFRWDRPALNETWKSRPVMAMVDAQMTGKLC
jgi:hypothetical protein